MMNKRNLRQAFRNLTRNKLNSIIIVISLTLGLAASFIIFSWASFEYSYDDYHKNKDRIFRVLDHQTYQGQDEQYLAQVPEYLVNTFESDIPGVELSSVLLAAGSFWIEKADEPVEVRNVFYSDNNLFNIFTFEFIAGDPKTCLSSVNNVVITRKTAVNLFGVDNPLGETIRKEGDKEYTVTGVIEDVPANSHLDFNMLISIEERKPGWNRNSGNHNASVYVLLEEGIKVENLKDNLRAFTDKHITHHPEKSELQFQPLKDLHLSSSHTIWEMNKNKFNKTYVAVLLLIGSLLLAISAINFFNLTMVSFSKRKTEIGIRKIIGSGQLQIIRQFLFENAILVVMSVLLASVILIRVYPFLKVNLFNGYELAEIISIHSVLICLGLVAFVVLLTGIFPTFAYSKLSPVSMLSGKFSGKMSRKSFNKTLVISQLVFSSFLIIATLSIGKQMKYIRDTDLGFNTSQVIVLPTNENIRNNYEVLKEELLKNPRVVGVTASNRVFGETFWRNSIRFEGQTSDSRYVVPFLITDFGFTELYDLNIIEGRSFSKNITTDRNEKSYLINKALARELGYNDPIGKQMRFAHTQMGKIIGVVDDFHFRSLHHAIEPMAMYISDKELYEVSVKINSSDISGTLAFLEKKWKELRPNRPFTYHFLDQEFAKQYESDTKTTKLVLLFTILSIVLSSLGLFGLIAYVAEKRTKEIGVRKVNGANISEIMSMLLQSYFIWGLAGFVISSPFAWLAMNKWLENFVYRTTLSWWIFALAGIGTLGIALLTVSWQSWRAATRNPVEALRYE